MSKPRWSYGVTTVPERRSTTLPGTLASLKAGGFEAPRLFIDGIKDAEAWRLEFGLEVTTRYPRVRVAANWTLALAELYFRDPLATWYFLAQDDLVCYKNLRQYLEQSRMPTEGYCNLYTFPVNQILMPKLDERRGSNDWQNYRVGWHHSNQMGQGAVALVFGREAAITLLSHRHMYQRAPDCQTGWRKIDGGIVQSLVEKHDGPKGWREYCHHPSLVQHVGHQSTIGNCSPCALSFRSESYDAMELLREA
jgi:hypothetical protein